MKIKINFAAEIILLFLMVDLMSYQIIITTLYLRAMKAFQNYEYYRHRNSVLSLTAISLYSIWNISFDLMFYTQLTGCSLSERKYFTEAGDFSEYCNKIHRLYTKWNQSKDNKAVFGYLFLEILLILPYFFFFLYLSLIEPHDCYECFNRLPSSRYSIFQYTKQELNE